MWWLVLGKVMFNILVKRKELKSYFTSAELAYHSLIQNSKLGF